MDNKYRVIYRGGDYRDVDKAPTITEDIWAVVNFELVDGGDAYQQLLRTLSAHDAAPGTARA